MNDTTQPGPYRFDRFIESEPVEVDEPKQHEIGKNEFQKQRF
jgi:hypothetical protein